MEAGHIARVGGASSRTGSALGDDADVGSAASVQPPNRVVTAVAVAELVDVESKLRRVTPIASAALDAMLRGIYVNVDFDALRHDLTRAADASATIASPTKRFVVPSGSTREERELTTRIEEKLLHEFQLRPIRLLLNSETWFERAAALRKECVEQRAADVRFRAALAQRASHASGDADILRVVIQRCVEETAALCFKAWKRFTEQRVAAVGWGETFARRRKRQLASRLGRLSIFRAWRLVSRAGVAGNIRAAGEEDGKASVKLAKEYAEVEVHISSSEAARILLEAEVATLRAQVSVAERKLVAAPMDRLRRFIVAASTTAAEMGNGVAIATSMADSLVFSRSFEPGVAALDNEAESKTSSQTAVQPLKAKRLAPEAAAAAKANMAGGVKPAKSSSDAAAATDDLEEEETSESAEEKALREARRVEDAFEATIVEWRPGQCAGEEVIPADRPFETRAGRTLERWAATRLARIECAPFEGALLVREGADAAITEGTYLLAYLLPSLPPYLLTYLLLLTYFLGHVVASLVRDRLNHPELGDALSVACATGDADLALGPWSAVAAASPTSQAVSRRASLQADEGACYKFSC